MIVKHWHLFRRQGLHLLWLMALCLGLWLASFLHGFRVSLSSTLVGVFHWLFVWAHYYCTELPDMAEIYGQPTSCEG